MADYEYIFIGIDLRPADAARQIATALSLDLGQDEAGKFFLSRPASDGLPGLVAGEVYVNQFSYPFDEPEEESVIDGYDLVWDLGYTRGDYEIQLKEAQKLFDELVEKVRWPALLMHGMDRLLAAWDPRLGLRRFPPGTSPDIKHRSLWEPYRRAS